MQNALYFENSHVRPVPLLIEVKKIPATDNHKKNIMHRFYIGKKYLPCWSVGKKSFQREIFQPPPPSKVKWFAPKIL